MDGPPADPHVVVKRDGPVAVMRFARERALNAPTAAMQTTLLRELRASAKRGDRALILTGAGRAFSAGRTCTRWPPPRESCR